MKTKFLKTLCKGVCHNQNNSEKWICDETVKSSYREVSSLGNKLTVTVTEPVRLDFILFIYFFVLYLRIINKILKNSLPINQLVRKNSKIEVAENLWITNAAYHLCEHQVQVTHIADCDKIFLRLNGSGFSVCFPQRLPKFQLIILIICYTGRIRSDVKEIKRVLYSQF